MANQFDTLMQDQTNALFDVFGSASTIKYVAADGTQTSLPDAIFDQSSLDEFEYLDAAGHRIEAEALLTIPSSVVAVDMAKGRLLVDSVSWHFVAHEINTATVNTWLVTKRRNVVIRQVATRRKK